MHMFCHQGKSPDTYITKLLYMASRQSSWQANYPSIQVFPHPTHARPGACPGTTTRPVVDGRVLASVAAGSTAVWSADRLVWVKLEAFMSCSALLLGQMVRGTWANGGF